MFACIPFDHKLYCFDGQDFRLFAFLHEGYWLIYNVSNPFSINELPFIKFYFNQDVDAFCCFINIVFDIDISVNDILISSSLTSLDITDICDADFKELVAACCCYCSDLVDYNNVNILVPCSYYDITRSH